MRAVDHLRRMMRAAIFIIGGNPRKESKKGKAGEKLVDDTMEMGRRDKER